MNFVTVDYIFGIIILIFAFIALIKGFFSEFFGKAAWVLGILCSIFFYANIADLLLPSINSVILCNILSFMIIFVVVFIIIKLVGLLLQKIFSFSILKSLDHALGLFFGLVEGIAVIWGIIFLLKLQPFVDVNGFLKDSFFCNLINGFLSTSLVK